MGDIITLDQQRSAACMSEVNLILNKYQLALVPEVKLSQSGMSFKINIVPAKPRPVVEGKDNA